MLMGATRQLATIYLLFAFFDSFKGILGFLRSTYRIGLIDKHLGKTLGLGETFNHLGKHLLIESVGHRERFEKIVEIWKF
jgi:hypothetical protein